MVSYVWIWWVVSDGEDDGGFSMTRLDRKNRHTGSSGLVCSALGALKLCAAHKMSLLFFSVSSILHAAKSAAAEASYVLCQLPDRSSMRKTWLTV